MPVCRQMRARKRCTAGVMRALISGATPKLASIGSEPSARSILAGIGIKAGAAA
jgi:hypothetical protein